MWEKIFTRYCGLNKLGAGTLTVIYGSEATQLVGIISQLHEESFDRIDTCGIVDYNHIVEGHGYILSLLLGQARVIPKLFALTSSSKATTEEGMLP